jgi:hypothetical protein
MVEVEVSNDSSLLKSVFVAAVTFLLSRYLATTGGYEKRHIDRCKELMEYSFVMALGATSYSSKIKAFRR